MPFGKLQAGCYVPFTEEWLPSGQSTIKALLVECCRDGCPPGRFSHLHRRTLELCQRDHRVLGHLPEQDPSSLIAQFDRVSSSRNSLGGSKLLPFKHDGGPCVLGDHQCCRMFLVTFPRSVSRHNLVRALRTVLALTCTVNCGTLFKCPTGVCLSKSCPIS